MTTPTPTTTAPTSTAPTASTATAPATGSRMSPGEMRRKIAQFLADNSGKAYTPGQVTTGLGWKWVSNVTKALRAMADQGLVDEAQSSPAKYTANAKTSQVASGAISPISAAPTGKSAEAVKAAPAAPAAPAPRAYSFQPANGPVKRPNGTTYYPRELAGTSDVNALRKLREAGVAVLLYGPPGTGKTSLIEAAYPDAITIAGDGDTTVSDFVGEYTQKPDGTFEFVYGPLIRAMVEGRCLFIDDATLISPKVLAVVYPAMDGRREIVVKAHKGEVIKAAPGFFVAAGHNPGVHGAILTEALASRFAAHIEVTSDYELADKLKINRAAVRVARNLATKQANGEIGWAPQLRELLAFQKIADVLGIKAAASNLVGIAPEEDRDVVAQVVATTFGDKHEPLTLGKQV
ncbi:AAA family ATPase [Thermomonospora cellulosilytica]|uniref:MoxR-like ATPase n=1 Tax=Thermomonospora cellulosilytica TaxID=1411118 RepID=A0A7W3N1N8_9ACTN|nr:AAA family ATPase [Thermomonospora cellulosilytica]MBA9005883.1 MoxR-like ATPase [Thermomonospora cellulosilytica]